MTARRVHDHRAARARPRGRRPDGRARRRGRGGRGGPADGGPPGPGVRHLRALKRAPAPVPGQPLPRLGRAHPAHPGRLHRAPRGERGPRRPLPEGMSLRRAALSEPFSVSYHAVARAGERREDSADHGRGTDRQPRRGRGPPCRCGDHRRLRSHRPCARPGAADGGRCAAACEHTAPHEWEGRIDVAIEASGTAPGLNSALRAVKPGGRIVQVGILPPGTASILGNTLVNKEMELLGSWRSPTPSSPRRWHCSPPP